jgi:hypothetical protein
MEPVNLSPKSLQALIDLKTELLSRLVPKTEQQTDISTFHKNLKTEVAEPPKKEKKPTTLMRHARTVAPAWQGFCRRGRRW